MPYDKDGKYYRQPVYNKKSSSTSQEKKSSEKNPNVENQAENFFKPSQPSSFKKNWRKLSFFQKSIFFTIGGLIIFGILSSLFSSFRRQPSRTEFKPVYIIPQRQNTIYEQLMLESQKNIGDILKSNPDYR